MKFTLVEITLKTEQKVLPVVTRLHGKDRVLCSGRDCPHFREQLPLLGGSPVTACALTGFPPGDRCQPVYLEVAEALDADYRRRHPNPGEALDAATKEAAETAAVAANWRAQRGAVNRDQSEGRTP